ncbi:MAG TPA: RNA polymerase subunit sigma-70 [Ruminococcus sp.]|nr:RNA polymerase subunit sigma-70 [Ruminococcus sp.]
MMLRAEIFSRRAGQLIKERLFMSDWHSDEELAVLAKDSMEAEGILLSRYLRLIQYYAFHYASGADADDLVQEGLIALLYAIPQYSPEKGTKFSSFAQVCIQNRMKNVLLKNQKNPEPVENLEEYQSADFIDEVTPESILLEKEQEILFRKQVMEMLSDKEWQVLGLIVEGATYAETARKLGISEKSVDNAMQRIRRKMRSVPHGESSTE